MSSIEDKNRLYKAPQKEGPKNEPAFLSTEYFTGVFGDIYRSSGPQTELKGTYVQKDRKVGDQSHVYGNAEVRRRIDNELIARQEEFLPEGEVIKIGELVENARLTFYATANTGEKIIVTHSRNMFSLQKAQFEFVRKAHRYSVTNIAIGGRAYTVLGEAADQMPLEDQAKVRQVLENLKSKP